MPVQSITFKNTFNMYGYTANSYKTMYQSYLEKQNQMIKLMYYYDKKSYTPGVDCIF